MKLRSRLLYSWFCFAHAFWSHVFSRFLAMWPLTSLSGAVALFDVSETMTPCRGMRSMVSAIRTLSRDHCGWADIEGPLVSSPLLSAASVTRALNVTGRACVPLPPPTALLSMRHTTEERKSGAYLSLYIWDKSLPMPPVNHFACITRCIINSWNKLA